MEQEKLMKMYQRDKKLGSLESEVEMSVSKIMEQEKSRKDIVTR